MEIFFPCNGENGIGETFIGWVKTLFGNATIMDNLNGRMGNEFPIERVLRLGCPLTPYLFLIVGEVLGEFFGGHVFLAISNPQSKTLASKDL